MQRETYSSGQVLGIIITEGSLYSLCDRILTIGNLIFCLAALCIWPQIGRVHKLSMHRLDRPCTLSAEEISGNCVGNTRGMEC